MIEKIIHLADVHIPNTEDEKPFSSMLDKAIGKIRESGIGTDPQNVRIVVAGDIFDFKNKVSPEANNTFFHLLNELSKIGIVLIIAGNHDMLENNKRKMDAITPVFEIENVFDGKVIYVDRYLNYESGILEDDGITWVLYSIWTKYKTPDLTDYLDSGNKLVGLFHGEIAGAVTDSGKKFESGVDTKGFEGLSAVMCGHVHKRQEILKSGTRFVYSGSLFQKDSGENISGHGFLVWDTDDMSYKPVEVENDYSIFKFRIDSYDDVNNGLETLLNS